MKQCTGCGRYENEPLGLNINGEPYLACCPDSNYVEVKFTDKEKQEKLIVEIMNADEKDGLYDHVPDVGNKVSAVEWLENELANNLKHIILNNDHVMMERFFLQAKQIERSQRIKDYNAGFIDAQCNHVNDAENYVNEQDYLNSKSE